MPYDAIVIGTGFGGAVAALALRLAGKKNILMIERGTWWITPDKLGSPPTDPPPDKYKNIPEFADTQSPKHKVQYWPRPNHNRGVADLLAAVRSDFNKDGLYQYSIFKEADILSASGVGGGSLIYSNVNLQPKPEVLGGIGLNLTNADFDKSWKFMEKYRGKLQKIVTKIPLPGKNVDKLDPKEDFLYLDRSRGMRDASDKVFNDPAKLAQLGMSVLDSWQPLKLAVVEYEEDAAHNAVGDAAAQHTHCERQGRCFLGCLPGARNTINKMLFKGRDLGNGEFFGLQYKDPAKSGITLAPQAKVLYLKRNGANYDVVYQDRRNDQEQTATAPMVFLAAGVMGSTEILLQTRKRESKTHLQFSQRLGRNFSTNGDFSGFAVNTAKPVYTTRGPINTCDVRVKFESTPPSPFTGLWVTIEDCGVPEMLAAFTKGALETLNPNAFGNLAKTLWNDPIGALRNLFPQTTDPNNFQTEAEMMSNIFFFNAMGTDDASGILSLDGDDIDLNWPDGKPIWKNPVFGKIEALMREMTAAMGKDCKFVPMPLWDKFGNHKLVVVHPLGGCPIGPDVMNGVADDFGRIFDGSKPVGAPNPFHPGLYVMDGAAIPGALAANPTLTIVAQAIKTVEKALGVTIPL